MILIAAAGKSGRWKHHLGLSKVMAPVNGVPLIHRTIGQVNEFLKSWCAKDEIGIITHNKEFVINPAIHLGPSKLSPMPQTGLGQSFEFWKQAQTTYLFLGDVCYTDQSIRQIFLDDRNEDAVTFFGHGKPSGGHHPELFAFSFPPSCQESLLKAMKEAADWRTQFIDEGARIPLSGGWFTYRILNHLPVFMHTVTDNFIELDENVMDIDSKEDYERVCKLYQ